SGSGNTGLFNSGTDNVGIANSGTGNWGIANSGTGNWGIANSGNHNTGLANAGNTNTGWFRLQHRQHGQRLVVARRQPGPDRRLLRDHRSRNPRILQCCDPRRRTDHHQHHRHRDQCGHHSQGLVQRLGRRHRRQSRRLHRPRQCLRCADRRPHRD
ncbi:hypothetical protein B1T45_27095, partial [Mycobacterium kansasii]